MGWTVKKVIMGTTLITGSENMRRIQGQVFLPYIDMNMCGNILIICFCFILLSQPIIA